MISLKRIVFQSSALGLVLLASSLWAQAASFRVNPVGLTLSAEHPTAVLTVINDGGTSTVIQLQTLIWSQDQGKDVFVPTRELLATPPIFTVAAGAQQLVRVGLRVTPDARQEKSYRLFLSEVPPPPAPGFRGLQIALRISIPIFLAPPVAVASNLQWRIERLGEREAKVTVLNSGNAHAHIAAIDLNVPGQNKPWAHQERADYVLPGQSRSWTLTFAKPLSAGALLELSAITDGGTVHAKLVLK